MYAQACVKYSSARKLGVSLHCMQSALIFCGTHDLRFGCRYGAMSEHGRLSAQRHTPSVTMFHVLLSNVMFFCLTWSSMFFCLLTTQSLLKTLGTETRPTLVCKRGHDPSFRLTSKCGHVTRPWDSSGAGCFHSRSSLETPNR